MAGEESREQAWRDERREFVATAREEELTRREALADEREAAADEREREVDDYAGRHAAVDAPTLRERAAAREERARAREDRARVRAEQRSSQGRQDEHAVPAHSDHPLAACFAELAANLFAAGTVQGVLDHLVTVTTQVIDGADSVSVSLRSARDQLTSPAYTDDLAYDCDQAQYRHGEGPCVDAAQPRGPAFASSPDLTAERAWPAFAPTATASGVGSVCSFGMFPDSGEDFPRLGALNVYGRRPAAFDDESRDVGMLLATHAGVALAAAGAASDAAAATDQLRQAMHSRDVIGQAKGILMERRRLTAEQAFDTLRAASNQLNVKLNEIATRLTESGEEPALRRR